MTSLPIERVPGNPSCSPLAVIAIGGVIATVSMTAAIADGGRRSHFSMDMSQFVDAMAGAPDMDPVEAEMMRSIFAEPLEFRVIDDTTYMTASLFSFFLPVDTPWVAFEADQSTADFGIADSTVDPGAFLALLRGVDDDAEVTNAVLQHLGETQWLIDIP